MSEGINISDDLQARLEKIRKAASEIADAQSKAQDELQKVLDEIHHVCQEAASDEDNEGSDAHELFQEDPIYDEIYDIARDLGGQVGGEYGENFTFWIPSTC